MTLALDRLCPVFHQRLQRKIHSVECHWQSSVKFGDWTWYAKVKHTFVVTHIFPPKHWIFGHGLTRGSIRVVCARRKIWQDSGFHDTTSLDTCKIKEKLTETTNTDSKTESITWILSKHFVDRNFEYVYTMQGLTPIILFGELTHPFN
jgi:hypothetical protein